MRKSIWSLILLAATVLLSGMMVFRKPEKAAEARFVRVERADVHQVAALSGRLAYAEEDYVYAASAGRVERVCVQEGARLAAQEEMFRLDVSAWEDALSVYAAGHDYAAAYSDELPAMAAASVIRAERDCTVRQVLTEEGSLLTAGMPVARVTSNRQQIVCSAAPVDAERLETGMWAWLSAEGEFLCFAGVQSVGDAAADPLTGMICREVVLIPEDHIELPEGAAVDVEVYLAGSDDVLSLPLEAITQRDTVWWVNGGRCTEIPAEIVLADEMRAWVQLPEGITVAVGEFSDGQRIVEASP